MVGANDTTTDDGTATFATDIDPNLLVGVALHELTHAMGRVPYGPQPDVFGLYRFTSQGARLLTDNIPASASYFSLDGGNTKIADYGQNSDPSDFLNSGVQGATDPFNEYYSSGTLQQLTAIDLKQLDTLGFHLAAQETVVIQTDGTQALSRTGQTTFSIRSAAEPAPNSIWQCARHRQDEGGMGSQTVSGYDIARKNASSGQFNIWSTDASAHYSTNLLSFVSGSNPALESYESTFHQDLNGDGAIGIQVVILETDLTTRLVQSGGNYFLEAAGSWTGPELWRQRAGALLCRRAGHGRNVGWLGADRRGAGVRRV
ncbi:hypothetical protein [Bradyrhizobium sp. IC3123]|uniref:hypothetical protein n=1 Tax=Bradyrhizobium sp. IC3123 TaxID=2793803 RepID=UPI001CD31378|nr:hypothetical protein [Bradyrhizobium sp. IC3123]